jgi:serine/threonine protein kinase/TPR repeat protein
MADAERYQHYQILKKEDGTLWELGRGAMGITYKAFDTSLRCPVALKVINNTYLESDIARQRFVREARAAAALRHQNVASVFHLGDLDDTYFYAMEFIDGETVDHYLQRIGPLAPVEALNIALQVSRALGAAAKQHLVHRDLKPANLMLVDQDGERIVKVIDFGLAKSARAGGDESGTLTLGGGFVGTPLFASPEQLEERDIDIRSDIYSLGATLFFLLTGRPPFAGSVAQVMSQHLARPVPLDLLQGLPSCLIGLVGKMMEKDRDKRIQDPSELRHRIQACLEEIGGTAPSAIQIQGEIGSGLAVADRFAESIASHGPVPATRFVGPPPPLPQPPLSQEVEPSIPPPIHRLVEAPGQHLPAVKDPQPEKNRDDRSPVGPTRRVSRSGLLLTLGLIAAFLMIVGGGGYLGYRYVAQRLLFRHSSEDLGRVTPKIPSPGVRAAPSITNRNSASPPTISPSAAAVIAAASPTGSAIVSDSPAASASVVAASDSTPVPSAFPSPPASADSPSVAPGLKLPSAAETLARAQTHAEDLSRKGDWQGALRAYLRAADDFPNQEEFPARLENLLGQTRSDRTKINASTFNELQPDLERAAQKGVVEAMLILGQSLRQNDPNRALDWYEAAAEKGNAEAMVQSGLLLSNRKNPEDEKKALEFFVRGAEAGDRFGKYAAGECYYFGKGVLPNQGKAVEYLREAAALGEPHAMDLLGTHFEHQKNYGEAQRYYNDAIQSGYPLSFSNLGVMYMNGEGVPQSASKAAELFRQGAEHGDPVGTFFYANCLAGGLGVPKDVKTATDYFRRAARAGSARAIEWCRKNKVSY